MDSKPAPIQCMPPVDNPYSEESPADHLYPPKQPAEQPNPPKQPAHQPYPPPEYHPGYIPSQYPAVQAPVITQQPAACQQTSSTTVVINQEVAPVQKQKTTRSWSSGLCSFFQDCYSLCMGLWCPCCLLFEVSSRMGEGSFLPCCCPYYAMFGLRTKLRVQENIQGSLMNDYCAVQCCTPCVLCQLRRELNHVAR